MQTENEKNYAKRIQFFGLNEGGFFVIKIQISMNFLCMNLNFSFCCETQFL
jgi:hypothetical protein